MASPTRTPRRPTVLVVGGGYAGVMAPNRVALRAGRAARVVLLNEREELVHRVRLHELLAGAQQARYPFAAVLHSEVHTVCGRASRIDAARGECLLRSGRVIGYDHLILAVGSRIDDTTPGVREHAAALAGPEQARAFGRHIQRLAPGATVVVVGAGLTGIEVAAELAAAHPRIQVRLLGMELAPGWPAALQARVAAELRSLGVAVQTGVSVSEVCAHGVVLADGAYLAADASVWTAGFGCPELVADSQLPTDERGRVLVDRALRVLGHANILAAGDIAAAPWACHGTGVKPMRMACATAMPMGAHAADVTVAQLRGQAPLEFLYRNTVQCVSLGRRRGMLVFIDQDDRPTGWVLSGRLGALAKESICRLVIASLRLERRLPGWFWWPGRGARRCAPTPAAEPVLEVQS